MVRRPAAVGGVAALALALAAGAPVASSAQLPRSIELAPRVAQADPAPAPRGVFFSATLELELPGGVALLASTPDGAGALCSDDLASLRLSGPNGSTMSWEHLFADSRRRAIRCIPPQRLVLGAAGRYTAAITLTDRFAPTYSSRPYYLVPQQRPPAASTTSERQGLSESAPPIPTPISRPSSSPAPTAPAPWLASPVPTASVAPALPTTSGRPVGQTTGWLWLAAGGLALLSLLALRPRPSPTLRGLVDLTDRASGEARTIVLGGYLHGVAVGRGPLSLTPLSRRGVGPAAVRIIAGRHGPELGHIDADGAERRMALRDGETLLIDGSLELRYRRSR